MFNTIAYLFGSSVRCPVLLPLDEVYKAAKQPDGQGCIVVLSIPFGTPRHQSWAPDLNDLGHPYKCRAGRAKVLRFETVEGKLLDIEFATSHHNRFFKYRIGNVVRPEQGYTWLPVVCGSGIHFFRDRREAERYAKAYI